MSALCTRHPHSSEHTARRCWDEHMRKQVAKKQRHQSIEMTKYNSIKYTPPLEVKSAGITVFYFYRGEVKK